MILTEQEKSWLNRAEQSVDNAYWRIDEAIDSCDRSDCVAGSQLAIQLESIKTLLKEANNKFSKLDL